MANWLFNLPVFWMTLVIFLGTFLVSFMIYLTVTRLAVGERAAGFRALTPGLLSPLGVIFGLLVAFTAAQVWDDYGRAESPSPMRRAPCAASCCSPRAFRASPKPGCAR